MQFLVVLALLGVVHGGVQEYWNERCKQEHGTCNKDEYENLRLIALRSTGCRRFCQCAHASTELDGSVTYYWVAQICPQGTLFDDSLPAPVCNHEHLVKCTGGTQPSGDACKDEHGTCTKYDYEVVRLVALESSGCHKFCQCAHASTELDGSVTYKWVEKTCPTGTLFDESLPAPVCNHADQVTCRAQGNNGQSNSDDESNSHSDSSSDEDKTGGGGTGGVNAACRAEHGTCNKYEYENVRLVPLVSSGCKKFCQCAHASTELDGSVTYHWVEQSCPAGLLFDQSIRVCNYPDNVECKSKVTGGDDACKEEHGSCNSLEYYFIRLVPLRSSGCRDFCQCAYASTEQDGSVTHYWVKQSCPAGTLFNSRNRVCDWPNNVRC